MKYKSYLLVSIIAGVIVILFFVSFTKKYERPKIIAGKQAHAAKNPVIIGYVGGYRGVLRADSIDVSRLSHINYAFVDIKDNRAWLHNGKLDDINLKKLVELKAKNPDIKILISIGGWTWSKHFSDAVLTDTSTKNFATSGVAIVSKYNLDGIDIDWEFPGMVGDSNSYRPEDKQHYTRLFKDLRQGLDSLKKITRKQYFVTTAVGASQQFIEHTEMDKAQQYLDFVNIMSYDFTDGTDTMAIHHTNLYASTNDSTKHSADIAVRLFMAAGVPANKLVIGIAFYGRAMQMRTDKNHGLNEKRVKPVPLGGFTYIHDSLVNKRGYIRYWDSMAHAPYLFNEERKIFITYDDEESVKDKCDYAKKHKLAGVMFWEYFGDRKEYLLKTIADDLGYKKKD